VLLSLPPPKKVRRSVRHVRQDLGGVAQELMPVMRDVEAARMAFEQLDA
jgi:hypothetical protein